MLKTMKEQLVACVQGQLGDISKVDTHELGEAIDMIKDLSEAIYYCTITDSMQKAEKKKRLLLIILIIIQECILIIEIWSVKMGICTIQMEITAAAVLLTMLLLIIQK